jgi:hypothetical protein
MVPRILIGLDGGHNDLVSEDIARAIAWFVSN